MSQSQEELKPCPFCGGVAEIAQIGNEVTAKRGFEVRCTAWGCATKKRAMVIRQPLDKARDYAIEAWNRRAPLLRHAEGVGWRPEVRAFADLMESTLQANDHKGGWQECSPEALLRRLREETNELQIEIDGAGDRVWRDWDPAAHASGDRPHQQLIVSYFPGKGWFCADPHQPKRFAPDAEDIDRIGREAADVANFAMMIADVCGALPTPPQEGGAA